MSNFNVREAIESNFGSFKNDLADVVKENSKRRLAVDGAPFGAEARQALEKAIKISERFGFKTKVDPEGYYGYAEIGEGEEMLGILGHLDVVPADDAENWDSDPFTVTERDGKFFGRGVIDDKGPMLASLYALKILLDNGGKLNKRVRFIFCTDEESLWGSVKKYVELEEHPTFGFTPDADFPLVYAEKGLVEYDLSADCGDSVELIGGTAYNAVAASAAIPFDEDVKNKMDELGYKYEVKDGKIVAIGKAAHAMVPEEGENAIIHLVKALYAAGKNNNMINFINDVASDPFAEKIFGEVSDEVSGKLKFNIGTAEFKSGSQKLGIDIRFPVTYPKENVDKALVEAGKKYGVKVEQFDYLRSLYVSLDTPLVKTLMQAYQEISGDIETQPISTGGATFARSMDNIVAFGALFPHSPKTEHQVNECVVIDELKSAMEVYVRAFELLATE